ncbi:MAG: deoxyribose-phosphate aldolase [Mariniphaga sp.]
MDWVSKDFDREFKDGEVEQAVAAIAEKSEEFKNIEGYKLALSCIDLTTLNSTDGPAQGEKIALKVSGFSADFPGLPNVAAICVYPTLVEIVKKNLSVSGVNLASVAAGFPSSQTFIEVKELETKMAIHNGANEIDIVLNLGNYLAEDYESVMQEISTLKKVCKTAHLKVILETGALKSYSKIWKASFLAMEAGADFIKTSTGKLEPAATPEATWVMCSAIKSYYKKTNRKVGFKAAGGIVETDDALRYIAIVKAILGDEWLNNNLFRIGASRLANNLLSSVKGESVTYF